MYKFTEEEREVLRREEGFSEELIDSLQYIDEDEYESSWRGCDDKQAMMEGLMRDDDPVDQAKVYRVLEDTLRVNAKGEISNVMFRGADAYFRARVRAEISNWVKKKELHLVRLDEDELDWIDKIQSRELFEELNQPNTVVLVLIEQYATGLFSGEDNPHNFLRALVKSRIYGCGNGWAPDDSLPNVFVVAINDTAKLRWDMNERSTFGVFKEEDLK